MIQYPRYRQHRFSSFQVIIAGFAAVDLVGALLLMLPIAAQQRCVTPFHEALFTSTSALCVTGLVVQDTGSYWSAFGQSVILLLIQIGGLGVITVGAAFALLSGRKISLKQRSTMQEATAAPQMGGIVRLTGFILRITALFELAGAALLLPTFCADYGLRGIWYALFHSISAFCNAGFDLLGTEGAKFVSLTRYAENPLLTTVIAALIVFGGLGFLTWEDICTYRLDFHRYRMQSKVILVTTAFLLVLPALYFYRLGDYIRQRRQELNLTQEQVCAGICEPVTLSRFENGRQTPSRTRINAILQRLGLPDDRYYALVTPEELEIEALEKEIVACNALKHVNEGFDKISQLEKIVKPDDQIAQQFILRSKVLLGGLDKRYSSDERIQMLMQAVQMTIPNFQLSKIEDYLYTLDEMKLVNQIGNAYSLAGDNERAADIFYRLLQYMRRHLQEMVTSNRMLPLVLYNFARSLDLLERYEESAKVARNGKEACIKYGHYQVLHSCLEIEAECDFFLGKKEESAERYREAFYICKVMGYEDDLQIIRNEAKKYLDIIF